MKYTGIELLWLFLLYSFFGWALETAAGTIRQKRFVNRGFTTGPFCTVYGVAAVLMTTVLQELRASFLLLFLGCMVLGTAVEWFAGKILERLNQKKWWDYSEKRWNFDGYICAQYALLWGVLGTVSVRWGDQLLAGLCRLLPSFVSTLLTLGACLLYTSPSPRD